MAFGRSGGDGAFTTFWPEGQFLGASLPYGEDEAHSASPSPGFVLADNLGA